MAASVHTFGGTALLVSAGYSVSDIQGFHSPQQQLDKQRKAQQDGEAIQRSWRPNATRSISLVIQGTSKSNLVSLIRAIEQETIGISQDTPLIYQYTPQDGSNINYLDVYSVDISYDPDKLYEIHNDALEVTVTMETAPYWRGTWRWAGTTNLLPTILATNEESTVLSDPAEGWEELTTGVTTINVANSLTTARSGYAYLSVNPDGTAANQGVMTTSKYWQRVIPSEDYVWSVWARRSAPGTSSMNTVIVWKDSAGTTIASSTASDDITDTYTRIEVTGTAPATAAFARLTYGHNGTSGDVFFMDDMQFELGTVASTFSSPGTEIAPGQNFLTDNQASIETDTTGFTVVGAATLSKTTAASKYNTSALEIVTTAAASDGWYSESGVFGTYDLTGLAWTYSVWMKHDGGADFDVTLNLGEYDGAAAGPSTSLASQTITSTWTRYEVTHTASGGGTTADRFRCKVTKPIGGARTFYADGQQLEQAAAATTFISPGPSTGQDSFSVLGDLPTEIAVWVEPVGDFTSEVYLGLHNQNPEGVATLVYDVDNQTAAINATIDTTLRSAFTPSGFQTAAKLKGTYQVFVQLTVTAAASDYKFRWAIDQGSPLSHLYFGEWKYAASQVTAQWIDLGKMSLPVHPIPGGAEANYWQQRIRVASMKDAGSGVTNVWRVVLVPVDNGVIYQSGVSSDDAWKTFSPSSVNGQSAGYQFFAGGMTLPPSWPTVTTDITTEQSIVFSPFIAGPGTVDMVALLKQSSQSLLKSRWVAGYYPKYLSPVQ